MVQGKVAYLLLGLFIVIWSLSGLAGEAWQLIGTPHYCLLLPEGVQSGSEIAATVDEIYAAVRGLWLPGGPDTKIPRPSHTNISEELEQKIREEVGLTEPQEPKIVIVLYADLERLWQDVQRYGVGGLFIPARWPPEDLEVPKHIRAMIAREKPAFVGMALSCCLPEGWQGILAHELVHALQFEAYFEDPKMGLDVRLFMEGMARWTEYALGYEQDFELHVREPVAIWLSRGGRLTEVPEFILYRVGASLVERMCSFLSPPEVIALFSPSLRVLLDLPEETDFPGLFLALSGTTWEDFLAGWQRWIEETQVTPAAELLYEEWRLGIGLREAFLWPLLSEEERGELKAIRQAIWGGRATEADLERADILLRSAWAEPTEELLEALARRERSLKYRAREISGPEAEAKVLHLGLLRYTDSDHPERYVRAFVNAVNTYLVSPALAPTSAPGG